MTANKETIAKNNNESGFVMIGLIAVLVLGLIIVMVILTGASGGFSDMGSSPGTSVGDIPPATDSGEVTPVLPLPGNCLIFQWKVESSFVPTMRAGSARLGLDPNWVMAIMAVETVSSFKPCIRNPYTAATGLIQFMPDTARELGTSIDALCGMSQTTQWRYVEEYLRRKIRAHGRPRDLGSTYMLVFTPIMTQRPDSEAVTWAVRGGRELKMISDGRPCRVNGKMRKQAYCQNQVYDYAPKDGRVTKFEAAEAIRKKYKEGYAGCTRKR